MLADVKARTSTGIGAVSAWAGCLADVEREWASLPDPYLRERAADVHAVGDQVLRALTGEPARRMTSQGVLVASDLTPAETAGLDLDLVTGVVLAQGSPTSHAAILARARDIPVVVAAGPEVLEHPRGHHHPARRQQRRAARRSVAGAPGGVRAPRRGRGRATRPAARPGRAAGRLPRRHVRRRGRQPRIGRRRPRRARSRGGRRRAGAHRVPVPRPERRAERGGAAGRVRRDRRGHGRPADHPAHPRRRRGQAACRTSRCPQEANPFLGQRGIRLSLDHRDLLRDQMAAICHTARRLPDQHHDPDGVDARRDDRGAPGARRRRPDRRASPRVCASAR